MLIPSKNCSCGKDDERGHSVDIRHNCSIANDSSRTRFIFST